MLYARRADHRNVVHWARVAERTLPEHTEFCFSASEVARVLKLRPRRGTTTRHSATGHTIEVEVLRRALGLTQAQLATAIGVAERTVQNWESGRVSPKMERRLRDLVELNEALERYLPPGERQAWLISPNDASPATRPETGSSRGVHAICFGSSAACRSANQCDASAMGEGRACPCRAGITAPR